jgi:hypothetical protein
MFFVRGIGAGLIEPHETEWFLEGYGDHAVDPLALSYYRHAWAVQDIGGYGESVFLTPDIGDESRSHAARILRGCSNQTESSSWHSPRRTELRRFWLKRP